MRKALKIILIIFCSILLLVIGALVYLNTPSGQNFVRGKAEGFLRNKIKTELHIGYLGVGFPKFIVLKDVFFRDQAKDTLLSVRDLKVDISMLALIHKKVDVQQLLLSGVVAHIYRNQPDTNFNFQYIITAFTGGPKAADTTKEKKAKDTTKSAMSINLDRVRLDDIHCRFDDRTGGMALALNLEHLDLHMKKLDLDKMAFHIKDLAVAGLQTTFSQDTSYLPPKVKKDATKTDLQLIADNVDLQRIDFKYNDALNKLLFGLKLGSLQVALKQFGLGTNTVDLDKLVLNNTDMVLTMGKNAKPPAPIDTLIKKDTTEGWNVRAGNLALSNVSFKMDNDNVARQPAGIDYSHLDLKELAVNLQNVRYTSDSISGNLKHLAVKEQSGVNVKELRTVFSYNNQGAILNNLYLQTPQTLLQDHLEVHYPSLATLKNSLQHMQLNVNLKKSVVAMSDVLLFVPDLAKQDMFRKNKTSKLNLEAKITGFMDNLSIGRFYAAGLEGTEILLSGRLMGLPDSKKLKYNFNIAKLQSSRRDVSSFVPDSVLASVRIPDKFGITGTIAGTVQDYNTNLYFTSSDGLAYIRGTLAMSPGKGRERYDMIVNTANLNLGHILKQDSLLGSVTANIVAKGTGFDPKLMVASVDGKIISAYVKGYRYHDINMFAKIAAQKGNVDLSSADPNIRILLKADADFSGKYAALKADLKIDSIDLQALKLYATELRASGTIHADFPVLNPNYPEGKFIWWQPVINADGKRYYLDSLYVISKPNNDSGQNIIVDMDVLHARIKGKTPLTKIGTIIQEHISRHYTFPVTDSAKASLAKVRADSIAHRIARGKPKFNDTAKVPRSYSLSINADVIDKPMLHGILPGLTSFDSIHLAATITPRILNLDLTMPNVVYNTTTVQKGIVQVRASDSAFTYKVDVDKISMDKFSLFYTNIHGRLDQNTITTNISISDAARKERFAIAADMKKSGDSQIVHLSPGLKLDYNVWEVAQPNRIVLANGGFYVSNFEISNSGQFIKANSATPQINTPMKVEINNFMLSNLTKAISSGDTLLADGVLTGTVDIQTLKPALKLTSNLQIHNLAVLGDTLGNLTAQVDNEKENALSAKVQLKEFGNDIAVDGTYYLKTNNGNDFDFNIAVNALAIKSFETLAASQIHNSSGFVRGKLQLQGTAKAPSITGELHTDNLITTVSQLNSEFKMPSEKITFEKDKISFNNFNIIDDNNNKAVVNGSVDISDLTDMKMDLTVKAAKWRAIHSTEKNNKMFYGDLFLTTNLNITGTASAPSVDGDIKILKDTKLTVVNQESNPEIESRKGIVVFINMKDTARKNILVPKNKTAAKKKKSVGSDFNVNVSADKSAEFSLVIDKASGDFLNVKGDLNMNAAVSPGGTIALTGSYALTDGAYQLNYNFIKRKFKIGPGSVITFAGDPVKGTVLDITAIYETDIAPYDLVQRQVPDPVQLNYYKQKVPFDVDLYMRGAVLTPKLSFDVQLPDNRSTRLTSDQTDLIQGKLAQVRTDTSELNKQVFAVLILNRFVSDDPFSSGAGSSASFTALQSVSTFIGEQLNRAAGKLVKGVDLSVDLATTEDYTTGSLRQRTDLNLAASKQLLNDRLKLTIGNDFELDGPQTNDASQSSYVPTNLAADYLLSPDGKYTLRGYRKAYDEGVLQGYVTETGLNFIVSLDYNKFKNVFKKKKKNNDNTTAKNDTAKSK